MQGRDLQALDVTCVLQESYLILNPQTTNAAGAHV
jgi:hypothetical protein